MYKRNIVKYQGKLIDMGAVDIRDINSNRAELFVDGKSVAYIKYGGNIPKALHISWIETTGQHKKGYATKLIIYVLSKYEELEVVELKAYVEKRNDDDMNKEELVRFCHNFTYGIGSKKKIMIW